MFLQVSVHGGGGCLHPGGVCIQMGSASRWGLHPGGGRLHPGRGVSASRLGLHPRGLHPGGFGGLGLERPPADTTGYGQQAGGKHPTGMH